MTDGTHEPQRTFPRRGMLDLKRRPLGTVQWTAGIVPSSFWAAPRTFARAEGTKTRDDEIPKILAPTRREGNRTNAERGHVAGTTRASPPRPARRKTTTTTADGVSGPPASIDVWHAPFAVPVAATPPDSMHGPQRTLSRPKTTDLARSTFAPFHWCFRRIADFGSSGISAWLHGPRTSPP